MGKTNKQRKQPPGNRKHPHGRGEDAWGRAEKSKLGETPPRAWGRPLQVPITHFQIGNTPTGVGKTCNAYRISFTSQKHPHGRGEDFSKKMLGKTLLETPPRAWGRPNIDTPERLAARNTPTGVGKTAMASDTRRLIRKHPHGRGEDIAAHIGRRKLGETPPRAWGRPSRILKLR